MQDAAIRQWSNIPKRKLQADWKSKVPEVELRMPTNNPEPQLPKNWKDLPEVELRMPVPSSQKLQTDAQKQTKRLFGRTTGNRTEDARLMNYRNENVVPGKNLINSIEMNRVARAVDKKMQQRNLWQKFTDGITPGGREARLRGFYNDSSIPEVSSIQRSIDDVNKNVDKFNDNAVNAFGDFGARIEPRMSYEDLINSRLKRK